MRGAGRKSRHRGGRTSRRRHGRVRVDGGRSRRLGRGRMRMKRRKRSGRSHGRGRGQIGEEIALFTRGFEEKFVEDFGFDRRVCLLSRRRGRFLIFVTVESQSTRGRAGYRARLSSGRRSRFLRCVEDAVNATFMTLKRK